MATKLNPGKGRVDLKRFERRLKVRNLRPEDYPEVKQLELLCFPTMAPWDPEEFESQLRIFAEGQIGIELAGKLVASSTSLIVDYSDYTDWHNWRQISNDGYIKNHDPQGDTLYGIEMMVHPDFRGLRLARRLYDARKELCREKNLARMMVGGRIPGYAAHKGELSVQDYVRKVIAKELSDPVLSVQLSNGFQLRQIVPDYLESDEDSGGHATCLEWPNLDHRPAITRRGRRAVDPVRVALVRYPMRAISGFEEFARQCEFYVSVASESHADFLLFPELFTLELLSTIKGQHRGRAARELAELTPRYLEMFAGFAVKYDVNIIGGSQFAVESEELYNVRWKPDGQPKTDVPANPDATPAGKANGHATTGDVRQAVS